MGPRAAGLSPRGFSEEELRATGLAQRSQQNAQLYDRFRGRIMFPLADVRGHVLGFGARAMRAEQKPKYLNTSDNEVYHKGRHLYGADLARTHATKTGQVILCEGYTDVIAMHQAGFANTVGLMGTALTADQVGELGRLAQTVLLALDSDSAGQEAMLKAYRLAAQRKLDLRVVELPAGSDPAELIQSAGGQAIEQAISRSVPFVRFRVDRILDGGDDTTPEGRDRMVAELRPVFATVPPSSMRMELMRLVAGRLGLSESLTDSLIVAAPDREPTRQGAPIRVLSVRERTERMFLAQCIAAPDAGEAALKDIDVELLFMSPLLQQAAAHLRDGHLSEPLTGLDNAASPISMVLAELIVEAGRWSSGNAQVAQLEVQRLQLELTGIERRIHAARAQATGEVAELAHRRAELKLRFDRAQERALQETGAIDR